MVYQKIKNLDVHFNFLIKIMEKKVLAKTRINPEQLSCPVNKEKCLIIANQERMPLSSILSLKGDINYVVLSWTYFNILIRNEIPIFHSNIQFLTSADGPSN